MKKLGIDVSKKIENELSHLSQEVNSSNSSEKVIDYLSKKVFSHNGNHPSCKISLTQLKEIFKRGIHDATRLEKPKALWALARINMFCKLAKGAFVSNEYIKLDRDVTNDQSFFIHDGIEDDLYFTYEQILEAKLESETSGLCSVEDFSFVNFDEFLK